MNGYSKFVECFLVRFARFGSVVSDENNLLFLGYHRRKLGSIKME